MKNFLSNSPTGTDTFLPRVWCYLLVFVLAGCNTSPRIQPDIHQSNSWRYVQWDVFTDEPLTGNQLAVFMEPAGLTADLMQKIAREMAFSETTFVFPSQQASSDFQVRIFSPRGEMPFAGHPTIGTAFALAKDGKITPGSDQVTFAEGIGPIAVELEWQDDQLVFAWMHQLPPVFGPPVQNVDGVAAALGLKPADLRSTGLPVQEVSCGSPFIFIPVASRTAVDKAMVDGKAMAAVLEEAGTPKRSIFIFSLEPADDAATVYSRMVGFGDREDPATGSASGPLGSYLVHHGAVSHEKAGNILSRQGVQMGRPGWIYIRIGTSGDAIETVRVGGSSVFVGEGTIIPR
jgi:trans-2,3-dihydro-3-hydroxyanthranilate isomerase